MDIMQAFLNTQPRLTTDGAVEKLTQGNKRFCSMRSYVTPDKLQGQRVKTRQSHNPFAIIISCSDSRVVPEHIFDLGIGEIVVIRIAGNIISSTEIGTLELMLYEHDIPLIIVLGHSDCGTVQTCLETIENGSRMQSPYIEHIQKKIIPSIRLAKERYLKENPEHKSQSLPLQNAVKANCEHSVSNLITRSLMIKSAIEDSTLKVLSAIYNHESGEVEFNESNQ